MKGVIRLISIRLIHLDCATCQTNGDQTNKRRRIVTAGVRMLVSLALDYFESEGISTTRKPVKL